MRADAGVREVRFCREGHCGAAPAAPAAPVTHTRSPLVGVQRSQAALLALVASGHLLAANAAAAAAGATPSSGTIPVAFEGSALLITFYSGAAEALLERGVVVPGAGQGQDARACAATHAARSSSASLPRHACSCTALRGKAIAARPHALQE